MAGPSQSHAVLTYTSTATMSAIEAMERLEEQGQLCRFRPNFLPSETEKRRISSSPEIHKWLEGHKDLELRTAARALLKRFVVGEPISDLIHLKRVAFAELGGSRFRHDIWSMRVTFKPQQRFFGAFVKPDWLVLLKKRARDDLTEKLWNSMVVKTCKEWDDIFGERRRFSGTLLHHYITFNGEHEDDRWNG